MTRSARSSLLAVAAAVCMVPAGGSAQVVASTFGPGDSYNTSQAWQVQIIQSVAQGFLFNSGNGLFLTQVRLALVDAGSSPYFISFLRGPDMDHAVALESWSVLAPTGGGIVTLPSVVNPIFANGNNYWVSAMNNARDDGIGWNWSDTGAFGTESTPGQTGPWHHCFCVSAAYDVTAEQGAVTTTPEPASLALFATGLVGLSVPVIRRRKNGHFAA